MLRNDLNFPVVSYVSLTWSNESLSSAALTAMTCAGPCLANTACRFWAGKLWYHTMGLASDHDGFVKDSDSSLGQCNQNCRWASFFASGGLWPLWRLCVNPFRTILGHPPSARVCVVEWWFNLDDYSDPQKEAKVPLYRRRSWIKWPR